MQDFKESDFIGMIAITMMNWKRKRGAGRPLETTSTMSENEIIIYAQR